MKLSLALLLLGICLLSTATSAYKKSTPKKRSKYEKSSSECATYKCGATECARDKVCLVMPADFARERGFKDRELCLSDKQFLGSIYDSHYDEFPATSFLFDLNMDPCNRFCSRTIKDTNKKCIYASTYVNHEFGCLRTDIASLCEPLED